VIADLTAAPAARALPINPAARYVVTSFGFLHGGPPLADLVVDLRPRMRDPHIDPAMRQLTGLDTVVARKVRATPGFDAISRNVAQLAYTLGDTGPGQVHVAIGCAGGRHRSVVVATEVASELSAIASTQLRHVDVGKPVVHRPAGGEPR
jgi:RNase adaptor protein for sRNA GlmZ degradation